jgi:hypothetical protein
MITKKQFAEKVISDFLKEQKIKEFNEALILQSSSVAVAAEYLDLIKSKAMKEYAASRGGIFIMVDGVGTLTVREMLDLLPETLTP